MMYIPRVDGPGFLTTHTHVLVSIARGHRARIRDIAVEVGVTERAVQLIVSDLVEAGYLTRHRIGRRNFYEVHPQAPMRATGERDIPVGELLAVLLSKDRQDSRARTTSPAARTAG